MFYSHFFLQKMYFNWDSPSRKQNCQVISSEFAKHFTVIEITASDR